MRIISGKYKAVRLEPPTNITARPTTDFAKEGLFNVLSNYVDFDGLTVLDLFAGTGSISFEFASRGAALVRAVEMSERQIGFIKKVIDRLKIAQMSIYRSDVFRFIERGAGSYDVVFADPPYQLPNIAEIPSLILEKGLVKPDGILIVEHGEKTSFSTHPRFREERRYGNVHFSIFSLSNDSDEDNQEA